jgi:hypothetical protein
LTTRGRLARKRPHILRVNGRTAKALTDAGGNKLDGKGDGRAGTNLKIWFRGGAWRVIPARRA